MVITTCCPQLRNARNSPGYKVDLCLPDHKAFFCRIFKISVLILLLDTDHQEYTVVLPNTCAAAESCRNALSVGLVLCSDYHIRCKTNREILCSFCIRTDSQHTEWLCDVWYGHHTNVYMSGLDIYPTATCMPTSQALLADVNIGNGDSTACMLSQFIASQAQDGQYGYQNLHAWLD